MLATDYVVGPYKIVLRTEKICLVELSRANQQYKSLFDPVLDDPAIFHDAYITSPYKLVATADAHYLLEIQRSTKGQTKHLCTEDHPLPTSASSDENDPTPDYFVGNPAFQQRLLTSASSDENATTLAPQEPVPNLTLKKHISPNLLVAKSASSLDVESQENVLRWTAPRKSQRKKTQPPFFHLESDLAEQLKTNQKRQKTEERKLTKQPLLPRLDDDATIDVPTPDMLAMRVKFANSEFNKTAERLRAEWIVKWPQTTVDYDTLELMSSIRNDHNLTRPMRPRIQAYDEDGDTLDEQDLKWWEKSTPQPIGAVVVNQNVVISVHKDRYFVAHDPHQSPAFTVVRVTELRYDRWMKFDDRCEECAARQFGLVATVDQIVPKREGKWDLPVENILIATDYLSRGVLKELFSQQDVPYIPRFDGRKVTDKTTDMASYLELYVVSSFMLWRSPLGTKLHNHVLLDMERWKDMPHYQLKALSQKKESDVLELPECIVCHIPQSEQHEPMRCVNAVRYYLDFLTQLETLRCESQFHRKHFVRLAADYLR